MNDVGHALDLATFRGHGRLIIPVDDLMEQLGIPLDRSHSFIQPGLEGHDWVPLIDLPVISGSHGLVEPVVQALPQRNGIWPQHCSNLGLVGSEPWEFLHFQLRFDLPAVAR